MTITNDPEKSYLAQGRSGESSWWRYLLGSILIFGGLVGAQIICFSILEALNPSKKLVVDSKTGNLIGIDPILLFITASFSFVIWLGIIWLVVRFLHQRPLLSLFTTSKRLNISRIFLGVAIFACLDTFSAIITWIMFPQTYKLNFDIHSFICFVPIALLFIPIQSLAEEAFFRGYLLQGLSSLIKNRWALSLINGFLFAIPHLGGPGSWDMQICMGLSILFTGFILSLVTIRTNSLEIAIGAHTANNLVGMLLVNPAAVPIETPAIFKHTVYLPQFDLPLDAFFRIVFYFLAVMIMRRQNRIQ